MLDLKNSVASLNQKLVPSHDLFERVVGFGDRELSELPPMRRDPPGVDK